MHTRRCGYKKAAYMMCIKKMHTQESCLHDVHTKRCAYKKATDMRCIQKMHTQEGEGDLHEVHTKDAHTRRWPA